MNTTVQTEKVEWALIQIVRRLPPERVSEVLDFAKFLEFQAAKAGEKDRAYIEGDARGDALLPTEESQRLLERMAGEALSEIGAGHARSMVFAEDGEMMPGLPPHDARE